MRRPGGWGGVGCGGGGVIGRSDAIERIRSHFQLLAAHLKSWGKVARADPAAAADSFHYKPNELMKRKSFK